MVFTVMHFSLRICRNITSLNFFVEVAHFSQQAIIRVKLLAAVLSTVHDEKGSKLPESRTSC